MESVRIGLVLAMFVVSSIAFLNKAAEPARLAEKQHLQKIEIKVRQLNFQRDCQEYFESFRQLDRDCAMWGFKPE